MVCTPGGVYELPLEEYIAYFAPAERIARDLSCMFGEGVGLAAVA
jgi:hypothetical protein